MMITGLYAGLLTILIVVLSVRTLILRNQFKVALGFGGHPKLQRAIRVHANACEYVPLCLMLMLLIEFQSSDNSLLLHGLGLVLLSGRLLHAIGVSQVNEDLRFRVVGMVCTFSVLLVSASQLIRTFVVAE